MFDCSNFLFAEKRTSLPTLYKMSYYAVQNGKVPGIYSTWNECQQQVKGFSQAKFKKFKTESEAKDFILGGASGINRQSVTHTSVRTFASTSSYAAKSSSDDKYIEKLEKQILQNATTPDNSRKRKAGNKAAPFAPPIKSVKYTLGKKTLNGMEFMEDDEKFIHAYTDGSCENNGRRNASAGLGVYWGEGNKLNTALPVRDRATNNSGEIQAATAAIKLAQSQGIQKLCINTDSQFLMMSVASWMPAWKERGWKLKDGKPVKNKEDFMELEKQMDSKQIHIKWNYVTAHRGILGNERADKLAKEGAEMHKIIKSLGKY